MTEARPGCTPFSTTGPERRGKRSEAAMVTDSRRRAVGHRGACRLTLVAGMGVRVREYHVGCRGEVS